MDLPLITRLCEMPGCYKSARITKAHKGKKMALCHEHAQPKKREEQVELFSE